MTRSANETSDNFRDDNATMFRHRSELQSDLNSIEGEGEPDVRTRRQIRQLRREIDRVTGEIVNLNIGLVRSYTRRFGGTASAEDRADFESAGLLGLMRAVDSYDPDCGTFGQWAFKPIQREVLRAVRDIDHPNLNLSDFEKRPAILRTVRQLSSIDSRYRPSDEEVAAAAGVTVAQVRRVLAPPRLESMSQTVSPGLDTEVAETIPSRDCSPEDVLLSKTTLASLEKFGLTSLDPRELYVIVRRFGLDGEPLEKLTEIGETLALSREAIRQIESKALAKLQHPLVMFKLSRQQRTPDHSIAH
jgi:RNA polymerase primary sigma factor/RNA polymerase nonessential primary-like sigma factor